MRKEFKDPTKNFLGSIHEKPSGKVDVNSLKMYCNETSSIRVRCFLGLNEVEAIVLVVDEDFVRVCP